MRGKLLRSWIGRPLLSATEVTRRQEMAQVLLDDYSTRGKIIDSLKGVCDLERLTSRVVFGSANARKILQLAHSLGATPDILDSLLEANDPHLQSSAKQTDPLKEIHDLIVNTVVDNPPFLTAKGDLTREGVSGQLDHYRDAMNNDKKWLSEVESHERKVTGINNLRVSYNKVFGYYIEVTDSDKDKVPTNYYTRKRILTSAERYITLDLKEHGSLILETEAKSTGLEYDLFVELR